MLALGSATSETWIDGEFCPGTRMCLSAHEPSTESKGSTGTERGSSLAESDAWTFELG